MCCVVLWAASCCANTSPLSSDLHSTVLCGFTVECPQEVIDSWLLPVHFNNHFRFCYFLFARHT